MARVFNIIRRLTDVRRKTKDGKIALAVYLGIKFAHVNSNHSGVSCKEIMKFFSVGNQTANRILTIMRSDKELFTFNEERNCVFANSCKSDEIKTSRNGKRQYRGDDVIKIDVPDCYFAEDAKDRKMPLKELLLLLERALILKEYDNGDGYKLESGDRKVETTPDCQKPEPKSQVYVSKRTGISRATLQRRLKQYEEDGILVKTSRRHFERVAPYTKYSFEVINKKTRRPMWLKCMPATYNIAKSVARYTHVIWDAHKRLKSVLCKSMKRLREEIMQASQLPVTIDEVNFRLVAARELERRFMYD